jgi:hypothetical protein
LDNSADYYTDNTDVIHYMPDAVVPGTTFSLSLTPPDGSILPIERLLPAGVGIKDGEISALVNLY